MADQMELWMVVHLVTVMADLTAPLMADLTALLMAHHLGSAKES